MAEGRTAEMISARGYVTARAGNQPVALGALGELVEMGLSRYVSPVLRAQVHAGLGEIEPALATLERAADGRAPDLAWFNVRPVFRDLRGDDRYRALLARTGLL